MSASRRAFLKLLGKASAAGVALSGAGLFFHNRDPRGGRQEILLLPDYRQELDPPEVPMSVVHHEDAARAVDIAVEALGGIDQFVRPGDRVLIKPNVGFDRPPSFGATTSPEVVAAMVRLCRKAGAKEVWVTDNPINNASRCFAITGIGKATEEAGGTVILPQHVNSGLISLRGKVLSTWVGLAGILAKADRLIGLPTVKDHNLAGITVTMKNWYGFLGEGRNSFHQRLPEVIADLGAAFNASLVVVDGSRSLLRNGPTGGSLSDVTATKTIAAGLDQVALDAWAAELMGRLPQHIPSITEAQVRGIGTSDWRSLEPVVVEKS